MTLIDEVLSLPEFQKQPLVLVDVGASGELHAIWKKIAPYSVCIAFDADIREMAFVEDKKSQYKNLIVINRILSDKNSKKPFYLTKSPFCSSALKPNKEKLKDWFFRDLFTLTKTVSLDTVCLPTILEDLSLDYIDWFKTDSQGTDLRVFKVLDENIIANISVAEFEPGINDAYLGEDKMHILMKYMESRPFWLSDLVIKGTQRIKPETVRNTFNALERRFFHLLLKKNGYWGEMTYINSFSSPSTESKRSLLTGWVFNTILKNYGFALELATFAQSKYDDPIFNKMKAFSVRKIKHKIYKVPVFVIKRIFDKLIGYP